MKSQALILVAVVLLSGVVVNANPTILTNRENNISQGNAGARVLSSAPRTAITSVGDVHNSSSTTDSSAQDNNNKEEEPDPQEDNVLSKENGAIEKRLVMNNQKIPAACSMPEATVALAKTFNTQEVLLEKNSTYRWPAASITKLMSTIIVMEEANFDDDVVITQDVLDAVGEYATFSLNERYAVNDLLRAAIVASSNDAITALAYHIDKEGFVEKMNKKAKQIGMSETLFYDPSGLSYLNQTTAQDLYRLSMYIYHNYPELFATSRRVSVYVTDLESGSSYKLSNTNTLVGSAHFYGGKTGYIDESGQNLLTLFEKNGDIMMIVVMSSPDRFREVQDIYNCL
jgi:D-alanyl-D-alanine carboxypeptidase